MKAIESYRDHFLALDYAGQPVAILRRVDGATDDDLEKFIKAHVPNAVELRGFADYLSAELESVESKKRIADLTRPRKIRSQNVFRESDFDFQRHEAVRYEAETFENDARLKILNEIVQRFAGIDRYGVKPRTPRPEPAPGETGRERARAAQVALSAAQKVDPKLAKLLDKRQALNEEIDKRRAEIHQEQSKREAKVVHDAEQRAREVEQAEQPKTLADKFRDLMRRQDANNPRKAEAIRMGLLKERKA